MYNSTTTSVSAAAATPAIGCDLCGIRVNRSAERNARGLTTEWRPLIEASVEALIVLVSFAGFLVEKCSVASWQISATACATRSSAEALETAYDSFPVFRRRIFWSLRAGGSRYHRLH